MNDMSVAIIPKSDQLNTDDLITGPRTITVKDVSIRGGTEQPVSIHFDGDGGKPYKPCKSMSRVLVASWGPDASKYKGRSMTLYRDPTVKWAGMEVGGIRISHLSDIDRELVMALTATKGSRKPFVVKPLGKANGKPKAAPATTGNPDAIPPHQTPAGEEPVYEARNGQGEVVGMFTAPMYLVEIDRMWADAAKLGSEQEFVAIQEHNAETIDALPDELKTALRKSYALHKKSLK